MEIKKQKNNIIPLKKKAKCPSCKKMAQEPFIPFCSKKCKLIDLGEWANEEKKISRPIKSEDFYED